MPSWSTPPNGSCRKMSNCYWLKCQSRENSNAGLADTPTLSLRTIFRYVDRTGQQRSRKRPTRGGRFFQRLISARECHIRSCLKQISDYHPFLVRQTPNVWENGAAERINFQHIAPTTSRPILSCTFAKKENQDDPSACRQYKRPSLSSRRTARKSASIIGVDDPERKTKPGLV